MSRKGKSELFDDLWGGTSQGQRGQGTGQVADGSDETDGLAQEPEALAEGQVYLRSILMALLSDPGAPPAAKASATRTLAEMDGLIGRFQQAPDRASAVSVASLSRAELVRELARVRRLSGTKPA